MGVIGLTYPCKYSVCVYLSVASMLGLQVMLAIFDQNFRLILSVRKLSDF